MVGVGDMAQTAAGSQVFPEVRAKDAEDLSVLFHSSAIRAPHTAAMYSTARDPRRKGGSTVTCSYQNLIIIITRSAGSSITSKAQVSHPATAMQRLFGGNNHGGTSRARSQELQKTLKAVNNAHSHKPEFYVDNE